MKIAYLLLIPTSQPQILKGDLVNWEKTHSGSILRGHVCNCCTISQRKLRQTLSWKAMNSDNIREKPETEFDQHCSHYSNQAHSGTANSNSNSVQMMKCRANYLTTF
jgi:hypothetical protein